MEVVLIAKDMGALLVCNLPQSQDASTQTNVSENRAVSDGLPSLGLPERKLEMTNQGVIPLMPRSSGSGWATREMGAAFTMGGASYLPWLVGTLEERPGEGYWLSFNQRLPIVRIATILTQSQIPGRNPRVSYGCYLVRNL